MYVALGSLILFSQIDMMPLETPTIFANWGCVNPFSIRNALIVSPKFSIPNILSEN